MNFLYIPVRVWKSTEIQDVSIFHIMAFSGNPGKPDQDF